MNAARLLAAMLDLFVIATPGLTDTQRARLQAAYEALQEIDGAR